jgi:hypothetical protein
VFLSKSVFDILHVRILWRSVSSTRLCEFHIVSTQELSQGIGVRDLVASADLPHVGAPDLAMG